MESERDVSPHLGVGDIRFGMDRETVQELLGRPDAVDAESIPDWESWVYRDLGLEITFDADEDNRCTYLQVGDPSYRVQGEVLIGLDLSGVEKTTSTLALGEGILTESEEGAQTLEFEEVDLEIHFEDGRSIAVGLSAEIDETDEFRFPLGSDALEDEAC